MKKLTLLISILLVCVALHAQKTCNLLPMPQQVEYVGGNFVMGKVVLDTPVWQEEWEDFIAQYGGEVVTKSPRKIEVKLISEVKGAQMNQEEEVL